MKHDWLVNAWYQKKLTPITALLLPLAWLFGLVVHLRRKLYQAHWLRTDKMPVPVIVVGNLTVGGAGKTPTVIALARFLQSQGYAVGLISRGFGGVPQVPPLLVDAASSPKAAGDEAVVIAHRTGCPVVVSPDRVAAARYLLANTKCNLIISDDGLQHYRLQRDIEVVVVDAKRAFGNQQLLPAGPLREPRSRLSTVDFIINDLTLLPTAWHSVKNPAITRPLSDFVGVHVHALAGIGHPQRFFDTVTSLGAIVTPHPFNDHHDFTAADLKLAPAMPVLMTEKDAVKCRAFASDQDWYLAVTALLPESVLCSLLTRLKG